MVNRFSFILLFIFSFQQVFAQHVNKQRRIPYFNSKTSVKEFLSQKDTTSSKKDSVLVMKNMLITERDSLYEKGTILHTVVDTILIQKDTLVTIKDTVVISRDTFLIKYTKVFD